MRQNVKCCFQNMTRLLYSETHNSCGCFHRIEPDKISVSGQNRTRQDSCIDCRGALQGLPLTVELLVIESYSRLENYSFLKVLPLVGFPCSSGWPYIHAHMVSTNWTHWVLKKKNKKTWYWKGNMLGKVYGESWREIGSGSDSILLYIWMKISRIKKT